MKRTNILLFFLAFSFLAVGMFTPPPVFALSVGDAAPAFALTTLDGKKISLDELKGKKPVMLVFWATWCPNCKAEVPAVNKIAAQFGPKGLAVIGINAGINDSAAKTRAYAERNRLAYDTAFDTNSIITRKYGVIGVPTIVMIDRRGVVRYLSSSVPDNLADHFDDLL